ncbi:hypothetical protein LTR66_005402 [Elasticomyces elasticus]|nr:hypothetical protein LTR66_005402 [Elasticomyces elasticus]KAK5009233.1 hypothetical protein LTR28_002011 [Elasticomyces elasticus]
MSQNSVTLSPPFRAQDHINDRKHHLLLACTGSVATIKLPLILESLSVCSGLSIRLILTPSAAAFLANQSTEQPSLDSLGKLANVDAIHTDEDEWRQPWIRGASILHIELRRWADLLVIAPLSANSLAKVVAGMSDNLLLSVVRAWDTTGTIDPARPGINIRGKKKIVVAPAMNTAMWMHPVTTKQIAVLRDEWGVESSGWFEVLTPIEKELACGDTGAGAMRDWKEVVRVVEERLGLQAPDAN